MEDLNQEYKTKEHIKHVHRGGNIIQRMLQVNDDESEAFSVDEYRNAINNERTKRQQQLRANNEELKRRREMRLVNGIIDPDLAEKRSALKQEIQSRQAQSNKSIYDKQEKLKERVMAERTKQAIATKIRQRNKQVFELRENMKNGITPISSSDNWNINTIHIENDENVSRIKRIIISKRRGRNTDEVVTTTL